MVAAVDIRFYAPHFEIKINGSRMSAEMSNAILSVEIVQEIDKMNSFRFELQDEFTNEGFRWLGHDILKFGNMASVSLGYASKLEKMAEGAIQNIKANFTKGIAPTFTVEGSDSPNVFLTTPCKTTTYKEKKDSDIVREIAKEGGFQAEVDDTEVIFPVKTKLGGQSYFRFISDLARSNKFEFSLVGRTLKFIEPKQDLSSIGTLTWGKELINFNPQLNTDRLLSDVYVVAWDPKNRSQIRKHVQAGKEEKQEDRKKPLASNVAQNTYAKREAVRVITDRPVRTPEEAQRIAESELNKSSDDFITGAAEVVGMPGLRPGVCVDLDGLGTWFSGKYYIMKVTHRIGGDGFRTTLDVKRNAL